MSSALNTASGLPDLGFETVSPLRAALKSLVIQPFANYCPAPLLRGLLRITESRLAQSNWEDPGGWRSMVISYDRQCTQVADRVLVSAGTMPMALRNRKRLASHLLARLIEQSPGPLPHVLCLGAGPGQIILQALSQASRPARATLVDINSDAFEYGRKLAAERNLLDRVEFIQADVRDLGSYLKQPPDIVKMLGICEYLSDEQIVAIIRAVAALMPPGSAIVFNSLSQAHGMDRFFRRVFGLHMIHRSPQEVGRLIEQGGIGEFAIHPEPLGVYHVIVGRKR